MIHVQGIARLHGGELLIQIAGSGQITRLHRGVRQQLDHFRKMGGLSGFLEQFEKFLERSGIVANVTDDGVQILKNLVGIFGKQAVGVLVVNLKRVLVLTGLHEGVSEDCDGGQVVVNRKKFIGERSGIGQAAILEISLEQIAQAIGIGIEVGNFLQRFDSSFRIAGLEQIASLHEKRIAVTRIKGEHALQNFFCAI